jgi:hypothetical protein
MSSPLEQNISAIGVSGSNNFVQVERDMITIGQQIIYQNTSRKTSIWFDVRDPVESFTGRTRELEELHKLVQRNQPKNQQKLTVISQITSISGLGGIGKVN